MAEESWEEIPATRFFDRVGAIGKRNRPFEDKLGPRTLGAGNKNPTLDNL